MGMPATSRCCIPVCVSVRPSGFPRRGDSPPKILCARYLPELAGDPELRLDLNLMPGDVQFLHNHTILHAPSAYEDWPEIERKRHP